MASEGVTLRVDVAVDAIVFDQKLLRQTLRTAGNEVAATARSLLRKSAGGGRIYNGPGGGAAKYRGGYQQGRYQASVAGQVPARITGTLARSIRVRPFRSGLGVAIRDSAFYALFLQFGASGGGRSFSGGTEGRRYRRGRSGVGKTREMAARPFMTVALAARQASLLPRIQEAAREGIRLQKVRR